MDASAWIEKLALAPHPEGGHYRETWRHRPDDGGRGAGSAIYYLLRADEVSAWHRVDADEIWHHYAGAPLELRLRSERGEERVLALGVGPDLLPQQRVPAGWWQTARVAPGDPGSFALVGCTVSPAFRFEGFELAPEGFPG